MPCFTRKRYFSLIFTEILCPKSKFKLKKALKSPEQFQSSGHHINIEISGCIYAACRKTKSQAQFNDLLHLHCVSSALRNPFFVSLFLRFSLSGLYRWYGNLTRSAMIPAPQIATANSKIPNCKSTIIKLRRIKALGLIAQISCHHRLQNHSLQNCSLANSQIYRLQNINHASLQIRISADQNRDPQNCRRTNLQQICKSGFRCRISCAHYRQ